MTSLDRCGKSRPHRASIPDSPVCSESLYRLAYPDLILIIIIIIIIIIKQSNCHLNVKYCAIGHNIVRTTRRFILTGSGIPKDKCTYKSRLKSRFSWCVCRCIAVPSVCGVSLHEAMNKHKR